MHDPAIPDILKKILDTKKLEIQEKLPLAKEFIRVTKDMPPALDFKAALNSGRPAVIAEIKKASPSAGVIIENFSPETIALAYRNGGADAVSILTDEKYFHGSAKYIPAVRPFLKDIPILRKDFILHPVQVYEARALGADSFLLISGVLNVMKLAELINLGRELGMEPLVEAHSSEELENAIEAGAIILGVNNRNLHNFTVDISRSEKLIGMMPKASIAVSESGIKSAADAERLFSAGYKAVLVGECLMRSGIEKCGTIIREFKNHACVQSDK
ncbi:MAG: hypothetical protein A2017_04695 [Lentisphaerae bacterium GWF2_44_16]|nr:MAG: hypothetical protein A2017_04695 [Lentisphaerae bacterium GWF2_44_16]